MRGMPPLHVPPCPGCGRRVHRRHVVGGKPRYAHKCPHGVPCWFGSRYASGGGQNGPVIGGPYYCAQCASHRNPQPGGHNT